MKPILLQRSIKNQAFPACLPLLSWVLCLGSRAVYFVSGNMHLPQPLWPCLPAPPWVGCDPVCLQRLQVTNSHPGALVIPGMYFSTLYALCPFLKFSKNLTGHRSWYQTEAVDKNSNWYTGHLKILAPVHSHLEDTLFCWPYFENFWHFVLMSPGTRVRGRFCSQKGGLMM